MLGWISDLVTPITGVLDKYLDDKAQKVKLANEIAVLVQTESAKAQSGQIAIDKIEAKEGWFQSFWRPFIGWVCAIGLAINFLVSPILSGVGIHIPQADVSVMMPLVLSLLGLGGMRSFDKRTKIKRE